MKVIITGGAGFIGGHAIRHFVSQGDDVVNVDKLTYAAKIDNIKHSKFFNLDIRDTSDFLDLVSSYNPDYIVNFAAETHVDNSIDDCSEFIKSNVEGVASLLNVCRKTKTRLCHISTDEVYGPATNKPYVEEDRLNPMNPYAATKASSEMLIKSFINTYGLECVIVRPSNNYGPFQYKEKFIPKLLNCIEEGSKFPLYGDGRQEREWTYVTDTVEVVRKLLTSDKLEMNSIYNLSSGISSTNIETIEAILRIYNDKNSTTLNIDDIVKFSQDRPGHDRKYQISSGKLNSIVSHKFKNLEEGIKEILGSK